MSEKPNQEPTEPSVSFTTLKVKNKVWAKFISTISQIPGASSTYLQSNVVQHDDNTSGINSQQITNKGGRITFQQSGTYMIIVNVQVGALTGIGDLHLWFRLNGSDVSNSNVVRSLVNENDVSILLNQLAIELESGDYIELVYSTTNSRLGIITLLQVGEPTPISAAALIFRA
ncbi:unnamed protein product [Didymodactylos carnosus]|uniref:C1q domain-containing protein n=1 Tax=Didymodactylos carnosus TaxID=1234261 RepID=A0A814KLL0_9BILA|nr:unnamed protein product [Didymodactylos carnosus]CAF3822130.1 unnamed protein product [Didymodactylos carnosus]